MPVNPFGDSPLRGLTNATCASVLMFMPAADLALCAVVCRGLNALLSDVASKAAVTLYDRCIPPSLWSLGAARALHFVEALHRSLTLTRVKGPSVTTGTFHTIVLSAVGQVYVFGESESGQVRGLSPAVARPSSSPAFLQSPMDH